MVVLCMIGMFAAANIAIVAGYLNMLVGLDPIAVRWVYESLPVIRVSALLTFLLPANVACAYFTAKDSFRLFRQGLTLCPMITTPFAIFLLLPGKLATPTPLGYNGGVTIAVTLVAQLAFSHLLASRAWQYGHKPADP